MPKDKHPDTEKIFQKVQKPYYLVPRAGLSTGELKIENKVFGQTREELQHLGMPGWFIDGHQPLEPRDGTPVAEWIRKLSGITERHLAAPEQGPVELGVAAARDLDLKLSEIGIEVDSKKAGLILACASYVSPDGEAPARTDHVAQRAAAERLAEERGIKIVQATRSSLGNVFTIENGCAGSGGMFAEAGRIFQENPKLDYLYAIAAEKLSDIFNRADLGTCPLLGDAGGATLLSRKPLEDTSLLKALGHVHHHDTSTEAQNLLYIGSDGKLVMNGHGVFRRAVRDMPGMVRELAEYLKLDFSKIRLVLPHLANGKILKAIEKGKGSYGLNNAVIPTKLYGENTSSQTVSRAIEIAHGKGWLQALKDGNYVAVTTVGLGWHGRCVMFCYSKPDG